MFSQLNEIIWDRYFWLPEQFTWEDFEMEDGIVRPHLSDLYIVPVTTILLLCFRVLFERYIGIPICKAFGIGLMSKEEKAFSVAGKLRKTKDKNHYPKVLASFEKKTALVLKSTETCWRFFAYLSLFICGSFILIPTNWIGNVRLCLLGFIKEQELPWHVKWYYIAELSFYTSLLFSQFYDTRRKDFFQLFAHHVITIALLTGSYVIGHFRIGSVIMWLHDASDFWLEAAKLMNYAKFQRCCDVLFVIFAVSFYLFRWVFYPFWVIYPWMKYNDKHSGHMRSYFSAPYIFLGSCFVLFFLHLYWGVLVGKMIYQFSVTGKVKKDNRSDDESDEEMKKY